MSRLRKRQICASPDGMSPTDNLAIKGHHSVNPKLCDGREGRGFGVYAREVRKRAGTHLYRRGWTDRGIEDTPWCWEKRFLTTISGYYGDRRPGFEASERLPLGGPQEIGDKE